MTQKELDQMLLHAVRRFPVLDVRELLEKGARIDAVDNQNHQPLHLAAADGRMDVVELLLASGARLDAANIVGHRPLHCAAWNDRGEMVAMLLGLGDDPTVVALDGMTPRGLCGDMGIREMLEKAEMDWKTQDQRRGEALAELRARQRKLGVLRPRGPAL